MVVGNYYYYVCFVNAGAVPYYRLQHCEVSDESDGLLDG